MTKGEWTKCYNPANGEMHEWEIWRDEEHEDEYFASCPSEADADMILAALTAQGECDELRTKLATWQGRAFKAEAAQGEAEAELAHLKNHFGHVVAADFAEKIDDTVTELRDALRIAVDALELVDRRLGPAQSVLKLDLIRGVIREALDRIKAGK